jgi:auxin-responsive protein IAA
MEVAAGLKKEKMVFDETELRLGLPGNIGAAGKTTEVVRKRSFSETESESDQTTTVDLKLNLSSKEGAADSLEKTKEKTLLLSDSGAKPPAK